MTDPRSAVLAHLRFMHEIGVREIPVSPAPASAVAAVTPDRAPASGPPSLAEIPPRAAGAPGASPASGSLDSVRAELGECTRCRLSESRTRLVFGVGNPDADLMFVGEAPGRDEDLQGEPFVGRAGQLLDKMIASIGLARNEVYIANVVKCRPPRNRNPQDDEIEACRPFLAAQIAAVAPRVIVTLGKFASSVLLGEEVAITRARGRLRSHGDTPLMPTFHPAYVLRQYTQENRRAVYDDLLQVKAILEGGSRLTAR